MLNANDAAVVNFPREKLFPSIFWQVVPIELFSDEVSILPPVNNDFDFENTLLPAMDVHPMGKTRVINSNPAPWIFLPVLVRQQTTVASQ